MDESSGTKKISGGESAAREMAEAEVQSSTAEPAEDSYESQFFDFAEEYREQFKAGAPSGFGKPKTDHVTAPTRFEDVSLCQDCKHCHQVTVPVNVRIPVSDTEQRNALGKIRRCLLGIKLPSDDGPEALISIRTNARLAPLAIDCSHFYPFTDEELQDMQIRRTQHEERMKRRREEAIALSELDSSTGEATNV